MGAAIGGTLLSAIKCLYETDRKGVTTMTQVVLNGQRVGSISATNLMTFLRVSTLDVVSHTPTAIVLKGGA